MEIVPQTNASVEAKTVIETIKYIGIYDEIIGYFDSTEAKVFMLRFGQAKQSPTKAAEMAGVDVSVVLKLEKKAVGLIKHIEKVVDLRATIDGERK